MPDLFSAFISIILVIGFALIVIVVLAALAVFIGAIEGRDYDEDFYPENEEEFHHLKK